MAARRTRGGRGVRALRVRRGADPGHRARGAVREGDRRVDGHRAEGDVRLHRQGRRAHHPAARGDPQPRPRLRRAWSGAGPAVRQAVQPGADVPLRTPAEGPLPAVSPARRRGVRDCRSGHRRGSDRDGLGLRDRARYRGGRDRHQLRRVPRLPARVRCGAAGRPRRAGVRPLRRLPAPGGDEPVADLRLQGAGRPADHRRAAAFGRLSVRRLPGSLRRGAGSSGRLRAGVSGVAPAGARPRLLHTHHLRDSRSRARGAERPARGRPLRTAW